MAAPPASRMPPHATQTDVESARSARSLKVIAARSMMLCYGVAQPELQTGILMTDPSATAEQPHEIIHVDQGMSIGIAAAISIVSIIVVVGLDVRRGERHFVGRDDQTAGGGVATLARGGSLWADRAGVGGRRHERGEKKKGPRGYGASAGRSREEADAALIASPHL